MGDGVNTASWFFVFWHGSFSLSVVVYALIKTQPTGQRVPQIDCDHYRGCPGMYTRGNSRADLVGDGGRGIPASHIRRESIEQTEFSNNLNLFCWWLSGRHLAVAFSETYSSLPGRL